MSDRDFWMGYMMGSSENDSGSSGGGDGSTFIAILTVIGGLVLEAIFFTTFGIEVDDVPTFFLIVGWIVGSCVANVVLSFFGRR